ncbi:MAG: thiamine phosphate synthase [Bauldia sp.]
MKPAFDPSLYLVTDRALSGPRGVVETARQAVAGGVTMVQLRDPDAKTRPLVEDARALAAFLKSVGIPFIVNDRVDVALASGADGVHVGQSDMRAEDARRLIGPNRILGLSITEPGQLADPGLAVVDYLGVGPIFATATKADAAPPLDLAGLRDIRAKSRLPIVAIGGISAMNAASVIAAGADGISVVSAIVAATDPGAAARDLAAIVRSALER